MQTLRTLLAAILFLAAGGAGGAGADTLVPKSGPKVKGQVVKDDATGVVFNPYWSPNPEMTWEVIRLPADGVKKVEREPHPEPEFFRRLRARKAGDTQALVDLAAYAKEQKLKAHAEMALALALAEAPTDAAALAALGGAAKFTVLKKGNPLLDADLMKALQAYAAEPDAAARQKAAVDLKARGLAWKPEELERLRRSALQPKGRHRDVPLSLHADRYVNAVYTLFVPEAYDPARAWPLLIGLHGGGPDGKTGDEVVGSGESAMNFYSDLAAQRGVIVACPDAQVAQWSNAPNPDLVRDVIAELRLLYHVDIDRIHLTGHSMGGFGAWALGAAMAEPFATVSPAAGGGASIQRLVETRTPVFVFHGEDDKVVGKDSDRAAAKQLRDTDLDFIYTELNNVGHGYPDSVRRELFDFILPRRNFDPAHKDVWPRSSFLGKVTPDEKTYLGDPLALGAVCCLDDWLQWIRQAGGRTRTAVAAIVEGKPAGAVEGLVKVLKDEKVPAYGRAEAARALGLLKDATAAPALRKAVEAPAARAASVLTAAAARALAALPDPEAGDALGRGVQAWTAYFEDKVMGEGMRYSDWQRSVTTLSELVAAWAALGAKDAVPTLEKSVVAKVFAANVKVETSERVAQDPSQARASLAKAVGAAYVKAQAPDAKWEALLAALAADPKARAAAEGARS